MDDLSADRDAVRRASAGEEAAYAEILARHRDRVFSFLLRLVGDARDAEDLAQDCFLKAFRALASYDRDRPLLSWLFGIARNAAIDHLRVRRPETLSLDAREDGGASAREASAESSAGLADEAALIERLLASLPLLYREALLLRHREELGVAEIARVLGLPEGTVKVRLFRGREMLKGKLRACGLGENL